MLEAHNEMTSNFKSAIVKYKNLYDDPAHKISAPKSIEIMKYHDFNLENFSLLKVDEANSRSH